MSTRRNVNARSRRAEAVEIDIPSDDPQSQDPEVEDVAESGGEADEVEEDDEIPDIPLEDEIFPPPGLKEISSLASWTVSTAKPGNGVAALRSADTNQFWQSDGPQPHLLSIHFFKLVSIVHMRIYLDFVADESYTPTKIQFLAGMGIHDLQEFAEMSFEQPTGWIDVDFSNVGPVEDEPHDDYATREIDWSKRPVLRAFLVQVKIVENHQNGKDTHLRAVQLFARDDAHQTRSRPTIAHRTPRAKRMINPLQQKQGHTQQNNIKLASWMMEPDLR